MWAALQFGPAAGLLTGAAAGLAQDVLSAGIIGVGGFSKTLVGFGAGVFGSQFIVANALPRFVVLVVGAVVNELIFLGLYAAIERRGFDMPWRQAGCARPDDGGRRHRADDRLERHSRVPDAPPAAAGLLTWDVDRDRTCSDDRPRRSHQPERTADGDADRPRRPCSSCWSSPSGSSRSCSTTGSWRWPRTTTSARSRCGRRAARCSTATARCWSRTARRRTSRSCASRRRTSIARCGCWRRSPASRSGYVREAVERGRTLPRYRPIRMIADASDAAARLGGGPPPRARRRARRAACRRAPIPRDFAAHLFGYVGEITGKQLEQPGFERVTAGALIGQAGVEQTYNKLLMGQDGARVVTVNSVGPRDPRDRPRVEPAEGTPRPADHRRRRPARRRGGLRDRRLQRLGGDARSAQRRDPGAGQPAGLRSQRLLRRHRRPHLGPRCSPIRCGRCRTAPSRAATRRGRRSRSRSRSPGSRKASSRRSRASSAAAARPSTAATSSATRAARTAASICATPSRSRATSTSTRSATWSASTACTSGRRRSASACSSASTCRSEIQGIMPSTEWKRQKFRREVVRRRDDLGRRSARARSR